LGKSDSLRADSTFDEEAGSGAQRQMKVPQSAPPTNSPTTSVPPFVIVAASFVMIGMTRIMIGFDAQHDRAFAASSGPISRARAPPAGVRRAPQGRVKAAFAADTALAF
jgi:hypothetical protein